MFRYIEDESAAKILKQTKILKMGTEDENLAKEMYERFFKIEGIDMSDKLAPIEG